MSFQIPISEKDRASGRFASRVRRSIQKAISDAGDGNNVERIAHAIGANSLDVSREISGYKDMSLGRVAELARALGKKPVLKLPKTLQNPLDLTRPYRRVIMRLVNENREDTMTPIESALACFVGAVAAYRRDTNYKALAMHLQGLKDIAQPIFRELSPHTEGDMYTIIARIGAGKAQGKNGMPQREYANALFSLKVDIKGNKLREFYSSNQISEKQVKLMKAAWAMLTPDTATVDKKDVLLDKALTILPDRVLRQIFVPQTVADQKKPLDELRVLVKAWTGRNDTRLTPKEAKLIKEKQPNRYKVFLDLRKQVNESWKSFIRTMCREKGGNVKISDAIAAMAADGIDSHPLAGLERLYISEDAKLYTSAGKEISASVAPGSKIKFNPAYNPRKDDGPVFWYRVPMSVSDAMKPAYTVALNALRKEATMQKVVKAMVSVPKKRPRWIKDLMSNDYTKQTLGAMVDLLFGQAMRIGSAGNKANGESTYGLSTLTVKHVRQVADGYSISYLGKDAVAQRHIITADTPENKRIVAVIKKQLRGKRPKDNLWTDSRGTPITASTVNAYLKSIGITVTAHKFRHIRGTALMRDLLEHVRVPKASKQADVEKIVKGLAVKVGKLLGHVRGDTVTPATAIKSYIVPAVIAKFFRDRNLRVPQWVPAAGKDIDVDD